MPGKDSNSGALEKVLILDFGGQYTHLIARRCREVGVFSEIVPFNLSPEELVNYGNVKALILSGGPRSVYEEGAPHPNKRLLESGLPIFGICYGHQLIGEQFGGKVLRGSKAEYGRVSINIIGESALFASLPKRIDAWMSHGDAVLEPPEGFKVTAVSESNIIAAMENAEKRIYSVQFHVEVKHTPLGRDVLRNFLRGVAGCRLDWRPTDVIDRMVKEVADTVKEDEKVVCGVSGGVDSMTTAAIIQRAIGDRLHVIFIDHGLLRKGERELVLESLKRLQIRNIHFIDASEEFLAALSGVRDPEEKRRIIGRLFIEVFERAAAEIEDVKYLAQGTIYPDRVESGATGVLTSLIKSHHNVAGLPEKLGLKLIEPLRDLYKDEVREVAKALGLPSSVINRHPFPGPGLAVRVDGEVTEEKLRICREANAIVEEEFRRAGFYDSVWQAFAVVLDSKWVGVKGDARSVGFVVIIRAVTSEDGMTADWYPIPSDLVDRVSRRITNEVEGVVMVAYAVTSKPPATIELC
ncbi:MAG: glutamine-hydrolyzing GMP synthase [Nitrososphaerota archaeon]|nr:glutamine-hydrolyzing GMP synthase [Candidatus Calditenuaceae archaeon]MDW8073797.1 glutamine-hydrolyzing GMP synthase [Nitrososphaerota archaeon]